MSVLTSLADRMLSVLVPRTEAAASGWFTRYCYCQTSPGRGRVYWYQECYYPGTSCCAGYHCDRCAPSNISC
jgi:hypothetical protein